MITRGAALIDPTFTYRYWLTREWSESSRTIAFIGLNPSTASATLDDPTLRRMTGFARRLGAGRLIVVNLFALRSPSPELLRTHRDPVGPECDQHLVAQCRRADVVIAAWGAHPMARARDQALRGIGEKSRQHHFIFVDRKAASRHEPQSRPVVAHRAVRARDASGPSRGAAAAPGTDRTSRAALFGAKNRARCAGRNCPETHDMSKIYRSAHVEC